MGRCCKGVGKSPSTSSGLKINVPIFRGTSRDTIVRGLAVLGKTIYQCQEMSALFGEVSGLNLLVVTLAKK